MNRNFDAGPSRDLNFDPLSWFEPPFWKVKKHQTVSIRKPIKNHAVDTSCFGSGFVSQNGRFYHVLSVSVVPSVSVESVIASVMLCFSKYRGYF